MKLYNLYQTIILEEIIREIQLIEAVSTNDIDNVLNGDPNKQGKFYYISFNYKSNDGSVSNRWVQVFQKNISTANNGLIDAYQVSRDGQDSAPSNKKHSLTGWKKFRLDRMSDIKVSKVPFYSEPKPYTVYDKDGNPKPKKAKLNKTGNNSPTVQSTQKIAKIGSYQYATSTLKQKEYEKQRAEKEKFNQQAQQQQPLAKKLNTNQPVAQKPLAQKTKPQSQVVQQPNPEMEDDLENKYELNK